MKFFLLCVLFLLICLFQASVWNVPLILDGLIILYVLKRLAWIFLFAATLGIFLDVITFQQIGTSSMMFAIIFFLIELYSRKFEVQTTPFVFFTSTISSIVYAAISGGSHIFLEGIIGSIIAVIVFVPLMRVSVLREEV